MEDHYILNVSTGTPGRFKHFARIVLTGDREDVYSRANIIRLAFQQAKLVGYQFKLTRWEGRGYDCGDF